MCGFVCLGLYVWFCMYGFVCVVLASYCLERGSPHQFSPIYSPSSNLPIPNSDSEHHFLANDKPRDKGGTLTEKPVPPGVDPSLYCTTCETSFEDKTVTE